VNSQSEQASNSRSTVSSRIRRWLQGISIVSTGVWLAWSVVYGGSAIVVSRWALPDGTPPDRNMWGVPGLLIYWAIAGPVASLLTLVKARSNPKPRALAGSKDVLAILAITVFSAGLFIGYLTEIRFPGGALLLSTFVWLIAISRFVRAKALGLLGVVGILAVPLTRLIEFHAAIVSGVVATFSAVLGLLVWSQHRSGDGGRGRSPLSMQHPGRP
jgi:hypothetical protein